MKDERLRYSDVEGAADLFTPQFVQFLTLLNDKFTPQIYELRIKRAVVLKKALEQGILPQPLPVTEINTESWQVPSIPEELKKPGIEISGPASITRMFINALNPGPDGTRAEGDLDDDEDSAGYQFVDTVRATINRLGAVKRTLTYYDAERNRGYKIEDGELPFFMHRERGLAVDEPEVTVDDAAIPASILGTALTLFYAGRAQAELGQGIYFYLPKLETAEEALFWKDFFDFSRESLHFLREAVIKAIILIESLPAVYQMEEMLYNLGPYAAGLNAARWDLKASIIEFVMSDPNSVWPDRFDVDIKSTDFLADILRRLVAICLKRGALPIGGMATALPSSDNEVNRIAAEAIRADKEWEAEQGYIRGWVAHIFHMKTAADPFKNLRASGWKPTTEMMNPDNYPVRLRVPDGQITVEGTRRNARMLLEYLEGWLGGRGAKGIDSLAGKPGTHPVLMEDLATARISIAQIAQRIRHHARDTNTGQVHDFTLVKQLLNEEADDILAQLKPALDQSDYAQAESIYHKSMKIAFHWINNYCMLDFRSLGSYTRAQLDEIALNEDAF